MCCLWYLTLWVHTSNAVAPGQQGETQYSVAETENNPQQVQHTNNLRRYRADPQRTDHKT